LTDATNARERARSAKHTRKRRRPFTATGRDRPGPA